MWDESRCPGQRGRSALPHWLGERAGLSAGFRLRGAGRLRLCSGSRWGGAWGVGTGSPPLGARLPVLRLGSGAPAELVVPGAGGREDGLGCGWRARPAAGAPLCVAAALCASLGGHPIGSAEAKDRQCAFLKRDHDGPQGDAREVGPARGASVLEPEEALLGDR